MTKARTLADFISDGSPLADGTIDVSEVSGAAPLASPSFTGNITVAGNVDGRDVAADGTKLDSVESSADVTDATNVTAAGALMDSELTNIVAVKALNQGVATTDEVAFDNTTLNALAKDITDTAVDVFVYDTSKDSDGGAWRKRTQHTSWYNETLNTSTRGSRKEFPSVAVIVAESNQVTIYDGDDPDLPMWMVFNQTAVNYLTTYDSPKAITAMNGILVCGGNNGTYGRVALIDFNYDRATDYKTLGSWGNISHGIHPSPIVGRNSGSSGSSAWIKLSEDNLINDVVNDVAMTVLPNAPIDAATGLPVPTIAIASDGGVSVIKDDGTVVDITWSSDGIVGDVTFNTDNNIVVGIGAGTNSFNYSYRVYPIPSSDIAEGAGYANSSNDLFDAGPTTFSVSSYTPTVKYLGSTANTIKITPNHIGSNTSGLTCLDRKNPSVAFITSDYNTGWMNGDIKLATLSDTDDTDVTGAELVTNGTFDSDVSGWTVTSNGTFTHSSGSAILEQVSGSNASAYQSITTVVGKRYVASCDVTGISSRVLIGTVSSSGNVALSAFLSATTITVDFVATSTTTFFSLQSAGTVSGQQTTVDNISVRLAESDRSVNGNDLQVFGSITKNPVASGADLVGYSGFTTGNYLQQPYNSGLDFGTGDWCYMWWTKMDSVTNNMVVFGRDAIAEGGTSAGRIGCYFNGDKLRVDLTDDGASGYTGKTSSQSVVGLTGWNCFVIIRRGSNFEFYINGKFDSSAALGSTGDGSYTNTSATLSIGYDVNVGSALSSGALALFRASATVPTPEQIAKIYEDEKVLFQENAQATLYGSSDVVTALAHDDTTDLLHVGTNNGRSVFQGLRRVDNTTDAVGTAISASNGLVAED